MTRGRFGAALGAACVTFFASSVFAAKTGGIALGERFRFFPSLQLEFRYDNNAFASSTAVGAPILRLLPKLEIGTPEPNMIGLNANIGVDWRKYFGQEGTSVGDLSTLALTSDLEFQVNPNGAFAFTFVNGFRRTTDPASGQSSAPINRIYDQVGPKFLIQPGGRALSVEFAYLFAINRIEPGSQSVDPLSDYNQHSFRLQGKWKFFQKTAVVLDFDMAVLEYVNGSPLIGGTPLKVGAGFLGQVTPKIAAVLKAGYGNSLSTSGPNFSSVIATAEATFKPVQTVSLTLGYQRDFVPANGWGNFYDTHHPYLKFSWLFFQRLNLAVDGDYQHLTFSNNPTGITGIQNITTQRLDDLFQVAVSFAVDVKEWFKVVAGTQIEIRRSNVSATTTTVPPTTATLDYTKVLGYVNVVFGF
ncbi:MAG: hypothetical protein HYY84_12445 [Deltaproteobacteria bacterium]|nr:hypothetical protein [Deltaproteobacteria bacterium]